ncbi:helix-turn-helix domain-containing protein, partial [Nocardia sp. NPDC049737]|uniref:PucR family transcriptional regulator n=1 Tax=Nocardia sp. NPDC049737 TaxID=3154358 RepID=UPI00342004AA
DQVATYTCHELMASALDGGGHSDATRRLEIAAVRWARTGVPLDTVHDELRECMKHALQQGISFQDLAGWVESLIDAAAAAATALSAGHDGRLDGRQDAAAHALVAALLGGARMATALARECGIDIAESYSVIAVAIPADIGLDPAAAGLVVNRLRAELTQHGDGVALARMSALGGTILIPEPDSGDALDDLFAALSTAARTSLTAATVPAAPAEIPAVARHTHELLDVATALGRTGALHRISDLALEFQITRSGPGNDYLLAFLDPLEPFPELIETLRLCFTDGISRRRIARDLNVHINTIDNRLKRITALTGLDPLSSKGKWYLHSALVARTYRRRADS